MTGANTLHAPRFDDRACGGVRPELANEPGDAGLRPAIVRGRDVSGDRGAARSKVSLHDKVAGGPRNPDDAVERAQEPVRGPDMDQVDREVTPEGRLDLLGLATAQQPGVHEHARQLVADGAVDEQRGDRGVHAARQRAQHLLVTDLRADRRGHLLDDRHAGPVRTAAGGLVQEVDGFLVQLHELALEGKVGNASDVLFALAEVVLEKEGERAGGVEECAFDGHLLDVVGLGELEGLRGLQIGCSAEVKVVTVQEDFECLGSGIGRAGTDKNGVQADLAGEAFMKESGALAMRHPGIHEKIEKQIYLRDEHEQLFVGIAG